MTSHIFLALGMWDDTIRANVGAMNSVNVIRAKAGKPPGHCGHYEEFAVYAYLQKGDTAATQAAIATCRAYVATLENQSALLERFANSLVQMRAWDALERGVWQDDGILYRTASPESRFLSAYTRALVHAASGKRDDVALQSLQQAFSDLRAEPHVEGSPERTYASETVMVREVQAMEEAADGRADSAIIALQRASSDATQLPVEFGPPQIAKPVSEALADVLLRAGRKQEAAAAYRETLRAYPGRHWSTAALHWLQDAAR